MNMPRMIAMCLALLCAASGAAQPPDPWQAIDREMQALAAVIERGDLAEVHHHAFAVRDLVRALPLRTPADQANVKYVDQLAVRLDRAGDAGDRPGCDSNLAKLKAVLAGLRTHR